jgi:hypothetical protein
MPIDLRGKITKIKTIYSNYLTISSTKFSTVLLILCAGFATLAPLNIYSIIFGVKESPDKNRVLLQHSLTINRVYSFLPIGGRKRNPLP